MIIIEKKSRLKAAREIASRVRRGERRKEAMLAVSLSMRQPEVSFMCTTRTLYRWLEEFKITLPR